MTERAAAPSAPSPSLSGATEAADAAPYAPITKYRILTGEYTLLYAGFSLKSVQTLHRGMVALRKNPYLRRDPQSADELNRVDELLALFRRTEQHHWQWVEEQERAAQEGHQQGNAGREHQAGDCGGQAPKQAVAIAYDVQRDAKRKKK